MPERRDGGPCGSGCHAGELQEIAPPVELLPPLLLLLLLLPVATKGVVVLVVVVLMEALLWRRAREKTCA